MQDKVLAFRFHGNSQVWTPLLKLMSRFRGQNSRAVRVGENRCQAIINTICPQEGILAGECAL